MASSGASSSLVTPEGVIVEPGIEPGASAEPMLVTTDSLEEFEQAMSASIEDGSGRLRQTKASTAGASGSGAAAAAAAAGTISDIHQQQPPAQPEPFNTPSSEDLEKSGSLDSSEMARCFFCSVFLFRSNARY